jgi:hypothetical protein
MSSRIQVGSILIDESPQIKQLLGFESEPYSRTWRLVKPLAGFSLDKRIRESKWNFFFMAPEIKAIIFGALATKKIQNALDRILEKVRR